MSLPYTCINSALALALTMLVVSLQANAANVETLLMPGKVIHGHAKNEHECTSCHSRFSKATQNRLCLDCHEEVDKDIKENKGYHGRASDVGDTACSVCHTDHKGRDANIVLLDHELLDHNDTDFALKGAHRQVSCKSCHKSGKPWREAPHTCIACHKEQDVHKGEFGKQCADCHTTRSWGEENFNHENTDFPLKGAHRQTLCAACHPSRRYKDAPKTCIACHRVDDVHRGGYGTECKTCHRSEKWTQTKFNHSRTDFQLRGAHKHAACDTCHKPGKKAKDTPRSCVSCHRSDDPHKGRNGKRCQECHNNSRWGKSRFNHDKDTNFPLRGPHAKANCNACHADGIKKNAPTRQCIACHKTDDVHQGELGKSCSRCHKEKDWNNQVRFDHDLTKFPLYGMHALSTCESCHTEGQFASLANQCSDCHQNDDSHKGALGNSCGDCHNANSWRLWQFDHDTTDYTLTGAHKGLACNGCHKEAPAGETPDTCISCHEADDAHHGRFGRNCSRCHSTDKFNHVRMGQ